MTFIGRADVEWTETESRGKAKVTIFYIAGETYFNHEITIYGAGMYSFSLVYIAT